MNPSDTEPSRVAELQVSLSDEQLLRVSSETILERGRVYAKSGAVEVLSEEGGSVPGLRAQVAGTKSYATAVWLRDGELGGECDCPSAEDGWFCKHQVALAIAWRHRLAGLPPIIDEAARSKVQAAAKRAQTVRDNRQALHDFLAGQEAAILAARLMDLADRDRDVERELQLWRKARMTPRNGRDLKLLLTDMLAPGRDYIPAQESDGYVRRAEAALAVLEEARLRDPEEGLTLSLHAMRRSWAAFEQVDDSYGNVGGLCRAIGEQMVLSLQAAGPRPGAFGDMYLRLVLEDPFGCFDSAAAESTMGDAARAQFRRALASRWRETKDALRTLKAMRPEVGKRKGRRLVEPSDAERAAEGALWSIERLHLEQLEAAGDFEGALAVLREDMVEPKDFSRLTQFLERHGRMRDAFSNAERGHKVHPDDWRLQEDLLRCYERDGWVPPRQNSCRLDRVR